MSINISNSQYYYDLFYQISFLLVLVTYFIEGYKRKYPWSTWLLVIVTVRIFFIIGSKIGAINHNDLSYFFENLQFPIMHHKNLLGALVFGFAGVGFAKILLKIKYPIMDSFAIPALIGMAIQRIGCLMVGCCYGIETQLPWGIRYGEHSPAFINQFINNKLDFDSNLSLSIHPVPIYFIISSIGIALFLILTRKYWKRTGNLSLFGLLLFSASRFIIEFF